MSKRSQLTKSESRQIIILNRKAHHDYFIEERLEAGLVLLGWEVKGLRAGRANLSDSYVILKNGEAWLLGLHISPLPTTAAYLHPDPIRTRKLLLHLREINHLAGSVQLKGNTIVPLNLYWDHGRAKCEIALVRGKKQHDKRDDDKSRDWDRQRNRLLKSQR